MGINLGFLRPTQLKDTNLFKKKKKKLKYTKINLFSGFSNLGLPFQRGWARGGYPPLSTVWGW
jgi:hypothetical protein